MSPRALLLVLLPLLACAPGAAPLRPAPTEAADLVLVESAPVETTLEHPELPDAWQVWPEMIGSATHSVDLAQFYVSSAPGSRLEPVLQALEAAVARGVRVRLLTDTKFIQLYPEPLERLEARGVQVRRWNATASLGAVLHAKYFVVDGREAFLGSQNFDWRALEHIQELGLRVRVPGVVRSLADVFAQDWARAGGEPLPPATPDTLGPFPARFAGEPVRLFPVHSPPHALPDPTAWDLPHLVRLIDGARRSVRVQLLTYRAKDRQGGPWLTLEDALKRAAARGVKVELLVAHWSQRAGTIEGLQALHAPPNLTVKLATLPRWSGGFIPYARVVHAKYLVVDGEAGWLGTSNWEGDYFTLSRNVGVVVEGAAFGRALERFFGDTWTSPYAAEVDPRATYAPPAISREK